MEIASQLLGGARDLWRRILDREAAELTALRLVVQELTFNLSCCVPVRDSGGENLGALDDIRLDDWRGRREVLINVFASENFAQIDAAYEALRQARDNHSLPAKGGYDTLYLVTLRALELAGKRLTQLEGGRPRAKKAAS